MSIHPTSIIDPSAKIARDVQIGPFCTIGEDVQIESGSKIISHAVIKGPTVIGKDNCIYQFSTIGDDTPDKKFKGEKTKLIIGMRKDLFCDSKKLPNLEKLIVGARNESDHGPVAAYEVFGWAGLSSA